MKITREDPAYRPITILLETEEDFDKLHAILTEAARNRDLCLTASVAKAAAEFKTRLDNFLSRDDT